MKKLFKCALAFVASATLSMSAAAPNWGWTTTTEDEADTYDANQSDGLSYVIEIKNANYSKQTTRNLKGLVYTDNSYTEAAWPLVECYHPLSLTDATYYNGHSTAQVVRQFGVSMGVVYWINPDQNCIYWWNTVTGESGKTTPTLKYPDNYTAGVESPNVAFTFYGSYTGSGSFTHDWHGNLIHMWNGVAGWNDSGWSTTDNNECYVRGYATYKAPEKYGELIDFHPKISMMEQTEYPVYRRKLTSTGVVSGSTGTAGHVVSNYNYYAPGTTNGSLKNYNYPAQGITWSNGWSYHKATSADNWLFRRTDFLSASGNLWGAGIKNGGSYSFSDYYAGYCTGYVFHARNNYAFGNMFADGQFTNWYLNYVLTMYSGATTPNTQGSTIVIPVTSTENSDEKYWWTNSNSYKIYDTEFLFAEFTELDYFWNVPNTGTAEYNIRDRGGYNWSGYGYNMVCGQNVSTVTNGTDWMNAPEVDSLKGHRVMVHNYWLNWQPQDVGSDGKPRRNGQIAFRSCTYPGITYDSNLDGHGIDPTSNIRKNPSRDYAMQGWAYAYNKTENLEPVGLIDTERATGVNCWAELERVNNNVLAAYTYVPGQGFSKYFITAVEKNNPVTNLKVTRQCYGEGTNTALGTVDVLISWDAQQYDRETLHRYQIYYQSYKRDANGNLVSDCNQTWQPLIKNADGSVGCVDIGTATTGSYTHKNVPYGGISTADTSDDYDITYLYMVIPIYDDSDHWGTEAIATSTVTSSAPRIPVDGTLKQQTEEGSLGTKYSFNLQLDVTTNTNLTIPYSDADAKASTTCYYVVAEDEASATALAQATSVECGTSGVTVTTGTGTSPAFASHNCNHYTATGYWAKVDGFTAVSAAGAALPSLVWHNVNPDVTYKVKVYAVAARNYNFIETAEITGTMYVPEPKWSLTVADFHKLGGDYGDLTGEGDNQPIGSFRRINPTTGELELSNPVTLNNANYYGTNGSVVKPLLVTEEVLGTLNSGTQIRENNAWKLQYSTQIFDGETVVLGGGAFGDQTVSADHSKLYSNESDAMYDIIGMHAPYEVKEAADGRNRKIYTPVQKTYKAVITVTYTRTDNSEIKVTRSSESDLVVGTTTLANLGVNADNPGILYYNSSTHWDENYPGYYPHYYNALMQFGWGENNVLNRYMGYFATSKFECLGHYTADSPDLWVKYFAGSVLSDASVNEYNTLQSGVLTGIGYDGTNNTNWSALAINSNQVPMMIHYVYGGEEKLTNDNYANATFDMEFTAEYPLVVASETEFGTIRAVEDPANYIIDNDTRSMYVLTVPQTLSNIHATSFVTTGVEGIITDACGGVKIYPNPVVSDFTLRAPMSLKEVKIFSMDGQLVKVVKDITDTTVTINVDELPQGVYIVNTLGMSQFMIKK